MKEKTNYGNWVPEKMLYLMFGLAAVFLVITVAAKAVLHKPVIAIVLGALCILSLLYAVYMLICHEIFAFGKGNMMAGVHEHLVDHLKWNGEGKLLDIGCGAAALTVRCAKAFPEARITAVDYWGVEWSYAKEQCERNARIEGVADQITFWKGDAAKLDFPDGTFDAAVSNFVFHESRRNLRSTLHRKPGEEAGVHSRFCDNTVDDKWNGHSVWKKISQRQNR